MFVHLHNHTKFSILDALCNIKPMVKRAKELGQNALAITDHGVVYGWIEFYKECLDAGIKPILGCELYVAPINIMLKDPHNKYNHMVALAKDNEGMKNLQKLCSEAFTAGGMYYGKPRVDDEMLKKYHEGIIFLSGCVAGKIPQFIINGDYNSAKDTTLYYADMFGKDNFYLEIQDHGDAAEQMVTQGLIRISNETGIPLVATNDCHYINQSDEKAHEILLYMRDEKTIKDKSPAYGNGQLYIKSEEEMRVLFPYALNAIENTNKIADVCNVEIKFHETKMPKAPIPDNLSAYDYLRSLCLEGLKKRYPNADDALYQKLEYELNTIKNMGFVEYFLVVWEYINWSRSNGVSVGPGRGSAAGSIAMYCLGITDIDPMRFDLVFERFLNPERVSMPDIDEDFDDLNRYKTIDHVRQLYGTDNVCQIITFGTMAAKKVLKSVGKVYGYEVYFYNHLASLVPQEVGMTLSKALEEEPDFKEIYETDENARKIIDMSLLLEGLPCNTSKHAAGVIIADIPVKEYIPLALTKDGDLVSQFNMVEIEELGLLKMDFLGLKTLSVVDNALQNIKDNRKITIDIDNIPYDDEDVFKFIGSGKTAGVFQLESAGMMSFMKQLKPRNLEDLIAGISLYRPGPMDFIPKYIAGKNDSGSISYACPQLEPILNNTYGCIVYQEQVMQIFQQLAGYSLGGADNIRRAMSKKKQYVIDQERHTFIYGNSDTETDPSKTVKGCIANGISKEAAEEIYDSMADFAKYAFNKSHAACYAVISYQTAWLKYHYPTEYMAAIMTTFISDTNKLAPYVYSAKEQGTKVLPPHIDYSYDKCTVSGDAIRMPLSMCKGVGEPVVNAIISKRMEDGKIGSFENFISSDIPYDKTSIEALIKAGAFDGYGHNRRTLMESYPAILKGLKQDKKNNVEGQMTIFDIFEDIGAEKIVINDMSEYADKEKLSLEKEVLGMFLSSHPLDIYTDICKKYSTNITSDFAKDEESDCYKINDRQKACLCGLVTGIKKIYTKNGDPMAFVTMEDMAGSVDIILFPETYAQFKNILAEDECFMFSGSATLNKDSDKPMSLIANEIKRLDEVAFKFWVRVESDSVLDDTYKKIENIKKEITSPGQIYIYIKDSKRTIMTNKSASILSKELFVGVFGKENIAIT